jgi:predicted DNA-binding transcriptional regulator AlpA
MTLPTVYRFKHVKERGIVDSWPQLKNLIDNYGFPPGRLTSPQIRAWTEDEIAEWYASRPIGPGIAKGVCARLKAEKVARRGEQSKQDAAVMKAVPSSEVDPIRKIAEVVATKGINDTP